MAKKKTVKKNKKRACRGFTLIELLVVIAIIGILATIVMVSLNTARGKARDARRVSDVRQIQLALQMYYDAQGSYPTYAQGLAALTTPVAYISVTPKDPDNVTAYLYCAPATQGYHLGSNKIENPGGPLNSDADITSDGCTTGTFSGVDGGSAPYVYDVTP